MPVMSKAGKAPTVKRAGVDPYVATLLGKIIIGKQEQSFRKGEKIFSQGDLADSIYFIQTGRIKIAVVSAAGKEAVLAMAGPHDFFGEGSLVNQPLRVSTATTFGTINSIPDREASNASVSSRAV
jgi:cyclic nucleotide-binding protein